MSYRMIWNEIELRFIPNWKWKSQGTRPKHLIRSRCNSTVEPNR
jgi:hypothetical protein